MLNTIRGHGGVLSRRKRELWELAAVEASLDRLRARIERA